MVDIITTKMHETYTDWVSKPINNEESRLTLTGLRRIDLLKKRSRIIDRENDNQIRDNHILQVKTTPPQAPVPMKVRPFMGLNCQSCIPSSRNSLVNDARKNLNLRNVLHVDSLHSRHNIVTRTFCHLAEAFKITKFAYPQVAQTVMQDERLQEAIQLATANECPKTAVPEDEVFQSTLRTNEERARNLLQGMRSTLSDVLLRITLWVLHKLLPCFLSTIVAHPGQIDMLKRTSDSGIPMIFVPLHRSHLDYIIVTFVLMNNSIKAPLVAAGDNLRIPVFGYLLRGLGAFFIKRRIDPADGRKDIVYRAVLHTYMMQALRAGHNIEFFIEGGRTRTGKPCMPKGGILSVIVDAYMDGTIEDALVVPVSINYERLVDGNFIREQLGQPKQMESFRSAIKAIWSVLNSNYGMMRIDFNQPFSLKELVKTFHVPSSPVETTRSSDAGLSEITKRKLVSVPSNASLYGTDIVEEKLRKLVESIARHVIFDATQSTAVMSTNAIAFLLLNKFREGVSIDQLAVALNTLRNELEWAGRDVGFSGDSTDVINHALNVLGSNLAVKDKQQYIKPTVTIPNVIELCYYSNTVSTFYAVESVLATALLTFLPENGLSYSLLNQLELLDRVIELCDILKYEYIFCKPCQDLRSAIVDAIHSLKTKEIVTLNETLYTEEEQWSGRFAERFNGDDDSSDEEFQNNRKITDLKLNINSETLKHLNFLHSVVRPLLDTYAVTTSWMGKLINKKISESELTLDIMTDIKTRINIGSIKCAESASIDPVKNSLKLLQSWNVLESYSENKKKFFCLSDEFEDGAGLDSLGNKVNRYLRN